MLLRAIRDGDWATGQRLQIYPLILLALSVIAAIVVVVASRGGMGPNDLPLGADFGQVWVAGREALAGAPDAPFDFARHAAAQRATFGPDVGLLGWHYPPYFLGVAALLARLPYLQALAVWQIVTLGLYLLSILALLAGSGLSRRTALVAALAYPAVFVNLGHGQNGFLTAALLGAAASSFSTAGRRSRARFSAFWPTSPNSRCCCRSFSRSAAAGGRSPGPRRPSPP